MLVSPRVQRVNSGKKCWSRKFISPSKPMSCFKNIDNDEVIGIFTVQLVSAWSSHSLLISLTFSLIGCSLDKRAACSYFM